MTIRSFVGVVGAVCLLAGGRVEAKPKGGLVSKEAVRQAITIFRRDPAGSQGSMARPLILDFAQDSPDVEVVLGPKLLPWMEDKALAGEEGAVLLTAYCAGDIASQLDGGNAHGAALVAACEQVIATYRQLQQRLPKLKAPGVEKLIELQRQRKLRQYVAEGEQEVEASGKKRGK